MKEQSRRTILGLLTAGAALATTRFAAALPTTGVLANTRIPVALKPGFMPPIGVRSALPASALKGNWLRLRVANAGGNFHLAEQSVLKGPPADIGVTSGGLVLGIAIHPDGIDLHGLPANARGAVGTAAVIKCVASDSKEAAQAMATGKVAAPATFANTPILRELPAPRNAPPITKPGPIAPPRPELPSKDPGGLKRK